MIMIAIQLIFPCWIFSQIGNPDAEVKNFMGKLSESENLKKLEDYFCDHTHIDCYCYTFGEPEIGSNSISLQLEFSCGYNNIFYLFFLHCFVFHTDNQEITVQDLIKNVTYKLEDWDKQKLEGFD